MLGKLVIPAGFSERIVAQGLFLMAVTAEDAEGIRGFPELAKHDPFDRLIVAQAANARLQLLTADRVLLSLNREFIINAGQ